MNDQTYSHSSSDMQLYCILGNVSKNVTPSCHLSQSETRSTASVREAAIKWWWIQKIQRRLEVSWGKKGAMSKSVPLVYKSISSKARTSFSRVEFEKETEVTTKTLSLASNLFTVPCFLMYLWHQTWDMRKKKKNKAKNPQRQTSLMAMRKELYIFLVGLHPFSFYPTFIIIINLLSYISVEVGNQRMNSWIMAQNVFC